MNLDSFLAGTTTAALAILISFLACLGCCELYCRLLLRKRAGQSGLDLQLFESAARLMIPRHVLAEFDRLSPVLEQAGFCRAADCLLSPQQRQIYARYFISHARRSLARLCHARGRMSYSIVSIFNDGGLLETTSPPESLWRMGAQRLWPAHTVEPTSLIARHADRVSNYRRRYGATARKISQSHLHEVADFGHHLLVSTYLRMVAPVDSRISDRRPGDLSDDARLDSQRMLEQRT